MLFSEGVFTPQELSDERAVKVLMDATDHAHERVRPRDILYAAVKSGDQGVLSVLSRALEEGAEPRHIVESIDIFAPPGKDILDVRREHFTAQALAALDEFSAEFAVDQGQLREAGLESLVACVLAHLDTEDRDYLSILDVDRAARALREQARLGIEELPPLVDSASGRLRSEEFSADAWACMEQAGDHAARLGYDRILPPHCFLALLAETEGLTEHLVRLQVAPQVGPVKVAESVAAAFRLTERPGDPLALQREALSEPLLALLGRAQRAAAIWGAERIDTVHLLGALLDDPPSRLVSVLLTEPLSIDIDRLRGHLERALREAQGAPQREVPFRLPVGLAPSEDLTWLARTESLAPAPHLDSYFGPLCRALHRTTGNHVLITGPSGVGRTTLLRELARRAAAAEISFLRRKRFLHVDCADVPPSRSGDVLTKIIAHATGRTDLIVCLDGLGSLLRGESGSDHRLVLRSALKEQRIHVIGVLADHEYYDTIATDRDLAELTTRIEMVEPDQGAARDMVRHAADAMSEEFGVTVDDEAVNRAVVHSADYIPSERLPRKGVKVLRRACEDLHYRRTELGSDDTRISAADVVSVVADISGMPPSQISGVGGKPVDFEQSLGEIVVGQPDAVRVVANELRRIKAGLSGSGRPASVMFFAGLTGVGKTELAKTIARFYSTSKRLQTYPMENFAEPHSISGIIGSPPGYISHDQGGRLINDLNSDPYCVFLLDEAEKAHPDVWRPFLNLFDEGWIIDQRGIKAFGDRAIFILTSNAGHDTITRMSQEGRPADEIAEAVKRDLRDLRHWRSGQAVFPPEFLGRIRQIVVFRPLDRRAMAGICRGLIDDQRQWWADRRGKELVVDEALAELIVTRSYAGYEGSKGAEGGRIVSKMISKLVEDPLVRAAEQRADAFQRSSRIRMTVRGTGSQVDVIFDEGEAAR